MQLREAMQLRWAIASLAIACTSRDAQTEATSSETTSSETTTGTPGLPDGCSADQSPFLQPECLASLRAACNSAASADACADAFEFDGYGVQCAWAKVVTFSDASSCAIASVSGRCEATIVQEGCGDFCADATSFGNVKAIPSALEIIELCGGPLGPWSALDSESDHLSTCGENLSPPQHAFCECATAACAAD
ncbi:MAG TPA: hypothetical protein VG755_17810 [Nannocystaceae bacterium]|nr:hypothetical protein [Nannocystaceae bacterium]